MKIKINIRTIFEYLFILCIILTGDTMYGVLDSLYNKGVTNYTIRLICLSSSVILLFVYIIQGKTRINKKQMAILVGSILFLGVYLAVTRINVMQCLEGLCIPFLLFLMLCFLKRPERAFVEYLNIYANLVYVIALISLVLYFGGTILGTIPGMSMEYLNNGWWYPGTNYYYLGFINDWQTQTIFGGTFIRNIGIFMEAPGFAFPLVIAFWWELFGHKYPSKKRIFVLLITIITTFSTKAFVFGAIVIFIYMYSNATRRGDFWKTIRWVLLPIISIVAVFFVIYVISTKAGGENSDSFFMRMSDLAAAFRTWLDYPFFGSGFYNLNELYSHFLTSRYYGNPTAGVLNVLAFGGLYMFVWYSVAFLKYYIKARHTDTAYIVLSFVALVVGFLFISAYQYNYFIIFALALGWSITAKELSITIE